MGFSWQIKLNAQVKAVLRRCVDSEAQLTTLSRRERRVPPDRRDPGVKNPEDFTEQVVWVYNNMWRPLEPMHMPHPSWWTLFEYARLNKGEFLKDYVKPLMVNTNAQKSVREAARRKADSEEGVEKLEVLLNGTV